MDLSTMKTSTKLFRILGVIAFLVYSPVFLIYTFRTIELGYFDRYKGDRAPYLQLVTTNSILIRWQSEWKQPYMLRYWESENPMQSNTLNFASENEFKVNLLNLKSNTKYEYEIIGRNTWKGEFTTAPDQINFDNPVRIWVTGDQGHKGKLQQEVRNSAIQWLSINKKIDRPLADFWLTTGDNAYTSGTNQEFQKTFFSPYEDLLSSLPVLPTYGNHDSRRFSFYKIFDFPKHGETGGLPSGSRHYYSYIYGPVKIIMLDTDTTSLSKDGKMAKWLVDELSQNEIQWVIVAFHHPPYTRSGHDSDNVSDSKGRLFKVRENILPILDQYGVDLVLTGHSHTYERTHLISGHYGTSVTFSAKHLLSRQQPYEKYSRGTVFTVIGASAKLDDPVDRPHPALSTRFNVAGSMVIDVASNKLHARYIDAEGVVIDDFTIIKKPGVNNGK